MLNQLHIQNLAVIEDATVDFAEGLNVFTGATGAGKSLVIGAFEALLGLRKATDMVRPGAKEARISGLFTLDDPRAAAEVGEALDQEIAAGEEFLLTRKLFASGRSSVSVNGQPATAAMLARAAESLVDIHGQHDHQHLFKPAHQLAILDGYAGTEALRDRFAAGFAELRSMKKKRDRLAASAELREQQRDLAQFQLDEIDAVEPQEGEFPELASRGAVLGNVQSLKADAARCYGALYEADGSINERLQGLTGILLDVAETDPSAAPIAEAVRSATMMLQEAAFDLSRYESRLETDPEEAAEVEARLNQLNRLIAKHGDGRSGRHVVGGEDPLQPVIDKRNQLAEQLEKLAAAETDAGGLDAQIEAAERALDELAGALTVKRKAAAAELAPAVAAQLAELGMVGATLDVGFDAADDTPSGRDRIEFLARTNPGQPERPLRAIASGGELSRVMLALKGVLHGGDRISVLVFDEVDANIGGRLGSVIGRKLRALADADAAEGPKPQVLCITHLAQIAAFGDKHFVIQKRTTGSKKTDSTATTVAAIDGKARVDELAEMLAGAEATPTTRKQARELLRVAERG
ncbi:DNA repair protein RecN [Phycisphaera mikurensis]|uniref:DNA repair protein RecN n=1 Tax=Phycisphaera mikurensis (strain NBRC 102666 / KCTC 22515 / FYK2301M01) TaxID=1142394 RepID=I0IF05_PHYMF|nr:DNA repair protein RecN [Phycisphaera mikurensis]MBB6441636.1 DNA repair protein RecN (Recombination protein N) [Phycisphaera mikurensis]BAM03843.1 DNA repair protein RecN [Phycisphaera mikurensis NBRC 102666]